MLTSRHWTNAATARDYFTTGLTREDYYLDAGEPHGKWFGFAAEMLGLGRNVTRDDFIRVCENIHPETGEQLTPRMKSNRRVAYEFCFACPKSVSLAYSLAGDERVLEAVLESARYAMRVIEAGVETRVRKGGMSEDRTTGRAVWAEFPHLLGRPVRGVPDPHLHVHCVVPNLTYDSIESRWKAAQFGNVKRRMGYYQAEFFCDLARRLEKLGYRIEKVNSSFELAGVSRSLIVKFSERTEVITEAAKRRKIKDPRTKGDLGRRTREHKNRGLSQASIRAAWDSRLTEEDRAALRSLRIHGGATAAVTLEASVAKAIETVFVRRSGVRESELVAESMMGRPGRFSADDVRQEAGRQGVKTETRRGETVAVMPTLAKAEQKLLDAVNRGRGTCRPVLSVARTTGLTPEQAKAAQHILTSTDLVTVVRGAPGVDLVPVMRTVRREVKRTSLRGVKFFSADKLMADRLKNEAKLGKATSLFQLLHNEKVKRQSAYSFLWIHEAGRIGIEDMTRVTSYARKHLCRVVLTTGSPTERTATRGNLVNFLEGRGAVRSCRMGTVTEPMGLHRRALQLLNAGSVSAGLRKLDSLGCVREGNPKDLAKQYAALAHRKTSVLAVVPTRMARAAANQAIREELVQSGKVRGKGRSMQILRPVYLSEEDRGKASSYTKGMVIEFQRNTFGFKAGSRWKVFGTDPLGHLLARSIGSAHRRGDPLLRGPTVPLIEAMPLKRSASFAVFEQAKIQVAVGDTIRTTKTAKGRGHGPRGKVAPIDRIRGVRDREMRAGSLHTVKRVTLTGAVIVENGLKFTRDFQHFDHGYAVTAATASSQKANHVLFQDAALGENARAVAHWCARAKDSFTMYTESKATLMEQFGAQDDRGGEASHRTQRAKERIRNREEQWRERMSDPDWKPTQRQEEQFRERERER